ncbi:23S rRNA (adenine(2058)-N(6))-methyltransferase Erm(O) [Nonomuraea roseoviolacea subsp. roseoviolacea]|uniref:23S rRNA (Adenine-N6)-dimethyltransferase n=1 Tax=Nonomuraea roseoviolacea subsp. carminata TaxID=160689 RepID=A0ABT1K8W1_9ACTN|nr:ErmE/ErmH/ErmO/ErmR family 23S rRNA (adenine(2058)-N(6))-methyltransferase [Nonomuraea roseoviolacea]MCP2349836.1 23S rRNA (adenine-N6)-dimethyltransferase [Nonomuraea roseoviolacea subsp. carminata]
MAQSFAFGDYSHTQKKTAQKKGGGRTPRDRARRELSQNFLVDRHALEQIVKAAEPAGLILEPGSGEGVLTMALASAGARVVGYELDPLLAAKLRARTRDIAGIEIVKGDFTAARPPEEPFAVVGNIPYSITSKIVDWCLTAEHLTSATLLTQLEYARKRSGDYGRWSLVTVLSWPWFTWELLGHVERTSFRPVPSVDSAILRIERRPDPLVGDEAAYRDLVELGFTGVGGSLRASLERHYRHVSRAFRVAGIAPDTVVAFVHPDQWITLFRELHR